MRLTVRYIKSHHILICRTPSECMHSWPSITSCIFVALNDTSSFRICHYLFGPLSVMHFFKPVKLVPTNIWTAGRSLMNSRNNENKRANKRNRGKIPIATDRFISTVHNVRNKKKTAGQISNIVSYMKQRVNRLNSLKSSKYHAYSLQ